MNMNQKYEKPKGLLPQVEMALVQYKATGRRELDVKRTRAIEQAKELGFPNPEESPKVKELLSTSKKIDIFSFEIIDFSANRVFLERIFSQDELCKKSRLIHTNQHQCRRECYVRGQ